MSIDQSPAARIRDVVIASRAVYDKGQAIGVASMLSHDMAHHAARLMREGKPGVAAFAQCKEIFETADEVHAIAVNHDGDDVLADVMAGLCACMMRGGLPRDEALAKCQEIIVSATDRGPLVEFTYPLLRAA